MEKTEGQSTIRKQRHREEAEETLAGSHPYHSHKSRMWVRQPGERATT